MQINNLKRNKSNRKGVKIGRGGTRGKTAGRGTKGQNARAGRKKRPEMRDFIKKIPKLRGRGRNFLKSRLGEVFAVSLSSVDSNFSAGETVNMKSLAEKRIIKSKNGKMPRVKILGGTVTKSFIFENLRISEAAKKQIEAARGQIKNA